MQRAARASMEIVTSGYCLMLESGKGVDLCKGKDIAAYKNNTGSHSGSVCLFDYTGGGYDHHGFYPLCLCVFFNGSAAICMEVHAG